MRPSSSLHAVNSALEAAVLHLVQDPENPEGYAQGIAQRSALGLTAQIPRVCGCANMTWTGYAQVESLVNSTTTPACGH